MDVKVIVALIAACASVVAAILAAGVSYYSARTGKRLQRELAAQSEQFQSERDRALSDLETRRIRITKDLEQQLAVSTARRDYEYEARKRLYAECEPLVFQATELAQAACRRLLSLADCAKGGDIGEDGSGWLDGPGYYFKSTAYMLLAPTTTAKMLQRRLTRIDLSLEPRLRTQYELLKVMSAAWTWDFELAKGPPELRYQPDKADADQPNREQLLDEDPAQFRRQGLYFGVLDTLSESMLAPDGSRCRSFAEFLAEWDHPTSPVCAHVETFDELFTGFHPARLPVLWRVLTLQHACHKLFLGLEAEDDWDPSNLQRKTELLLNNPIELDWRTSRNDATDESIQDPWNIATAHLHRSVSEIAMRLGDSSPHMAENQLMMNPTN